MLNQYISLCIREVVAHVPGVYVGVGVGVWAGGCAGLSLSVFIFGHNQGGSVEIALSFKRFL